MTTKRRVKIALEDLTTGPNGLHAVYEQTMNRIQGQGQDRKELAEFILLWIVHARRPLSIRELRHALGVGPNSTEVDEDDIPSISILKSVCAGLIQVVERCDKDNIRVQMVELIHYTAQEYFEKTQAKWFPDAQRYITQTCVAYLSFPSLSGYCDDHQKLAERLKAYPFYDYAASEWSEHARTLSAEPRVVLFLQQREAVQGLIQTLMMIPSRMTRSKQWSQDFSKGMNGLHLAALFGLHNTAQELLDSFDINEVDSGHRTPLMLAMGDLKMMELLITTGNADVNVINKCGETALLVAAKRGKSEVVKLLLNTGHAEVNVVDEFGETALLVATRRGCSEVVELLLDTGNADLNVIDEFGDTALWTAIKKGYLNIVQMLVKIGNTDVDMIGKGSQTALMAAAGGGHLSVVEFLTQTGNASIDITDDSGRTALVFAVKGGHSRVVEFLMKTGNADVNLRDHSGRAPLWWAYRGGHEDIVKLLMEAEGFEINHGLQSSLIVATVNKSLAAVKLLVTTRKADVNWKDRNGRTALIHATLVEAESIVRFLLDSGADTGIIDTKGYSASDFARRMRLKSIEDLLKSKGTSLGEATQVQSRTEQL